MVKGGEGTLLVLLLTIGVTAPLSAQCPDGSPPPCRAPAAARPAAPAPNSVAVLYFDNLSLDSSDAYLADGLTEAVIDRLGQLERLIVKARAVVGRYRGTSDAVAVGYTLGVSYVVSGGVRRRAGRLRINVELIRVASGDRLWGTRYDRAEGAIQAIEEEISQEVATAVAGRLLSRDRAALRAWPTRNAQAYDHFWRGNYYLAQRTPPALLRAIAEYEAAVRLDRNFAAALARIAYGYALYLAFGESTSRDSLLALGLGAANRALRQDSTTPDAWMARGLLLTYQHPLAFDGAREAFERATLLDPRSAEAQHSYGDVLLTLGDDSAAAAAFHRALALEPGRAITLDHLAILSYVQRHYDEAGGWLDSAHAIDPGLQDPYGTRILLHLQRGEVSDARRLADALMRFGAAGAAPIAALAILTVLDARTGDTTAARQHLANLLRAVGAADHPAPAQGFLVGWPLVALGDMEPALDFLERVQPRGAALSFYLRFPEFDAVRSHPRFQRLVEESRPR